MSPVITGCDSCCYASIGASRLWGLNIWGQEAIMTNNKIGQVNKEALKRRLVSSVICGYLLLEANMAMAAPGILQLATRQGFWTNEFPDRFILLQHYRYVDGEINTPGGKQDLTQHLSLTRLIDSWHFGDRDQYQFVMQGVLPFTSLSVGNTNLNGLADPLTYTAFGWNNQDKTTALQLFTIMRYPFGDSTLTTDAFGNFTGLGIQQKWGKLHLDAAAGYWSEFDQQGASNTSGKSYWEANGVLSYKFTNKFSLYNQWDYKNTEESTVLGVDQNDDGHNLGTAIGFGYNITPTFQIDAKGYTDLDNKNEGIDEDISFNVRFLLVF